MSSIATDEDIVDRWIEIDDSISVPEQTLDEILADKILDLDEEILCGLDDEESLFTSPQQSSPISSVPSYTLDSPLHIRELESMTYQLKTRSDSFGGRARALAVSNTNVAIGTSRGLVLIFDCGNQRLVQSLTTDGCPVSCLDFNKASTLLAIGYGSGLIRIFNVTTGKVMDNVSDVVQTGQGVLQILFCESDKRLACLDSGGSVYELTLPTTVRSRKTRCIFSGCHGEVVYLKMLDSGVLALLSLKKLFLVSLKKMCLIYAISFIGPANRPPLIDCQTVNIKETSESKTTAFCLGRGSRVDFYYLSCEFSSLRVIRYGELSLGFDMINLKWVESCYLIAVDDVERVHMIDTMQGDIAIGNIRDVQLAYATADFKGLSTGGNVSAALDYLADCVCYQSICRIEKMIFLLGQSSIYMISVSDQITQLENLINRGQMVSAILFALDIVMGRVVNKREGLNLRHVVSSRIPSLIQSLLALTTSGPANGKVTQLVDHYKKHIQLLIRACVATSQFDLLYNTVYSCLEKDTLSKAIFFDLIDEVVLDGRLENPPPALVSDYFHHLISEGNLNQFEAAVVRIPVEKQDIHFVMTTCRKNRLYDGVIYVYNKAMSDYIGPLEEIFDNLAELTDCEMLSDCEIALGNKLLLYIQCCLSGRAYPIGSLPEKVVATLPLQVYRCLISYKGKNGTSASVTYPYLQLLIKFDAVQFFNVIFTCSDSDIFNSEDGRLQRITEVVYQIIKSMDRSAVLFINYFTLVAYLLQKKAIFPALDTINETRKFISKHCTFQNAFVLQLIEMVLSFGESIERVADAERCVVEVMRIVNGLDEMKILRQARKLPQYVCSYIFVNRREFVSLMECYLSSPTNARFAKIDYSQTAEIILDHFMEWLSKETLEDSDALLLYYCFLARRDRGYRTLTDSEERDEQLLILAVKEAVVHNLFENLDMQLSEFLRYWLTIASRTDRCLNYTVKNGFILSSVLLLEARKLLEGAFELLEYELEKRWMKDAMLSSKYIYEAIRLANIYHEEARQGNWLFKILNRMLSLPESELQEEPGLEGVVVVLNNVITAIMESGSSDAERLQATRRTAGLIRSTTCISCGCSPRKSSYLYRHHYMSVCFSGFCTNFRSKFISHFSCGHIVHMDCDSQNSSHYCLCQINAFSCYNITNNLTCGPSQMTRKPARIDIFSEESLKLLLGPHRLES
uniref:Vacuolar protein sorting-associated protein 8 central domain-containing protein n=1 Tax=Wuchereria bancrofti TaxID=6293 RepID=A0A1I8EGR8_WUCBA